MRRSTTALMATGLVGALFIAAPGLAGPDHKNNHRFAGSEPETHDCNDDGDYIEFAGDQTLWPPNHKYAPYTVSAVDAGEDDMVTAIETELTHDEYADDGTEMNGAGNTTEDAMPPAAADPNEDGGDVASVDHQIRAERSGRGDGRAYTFTVEAEFDEGVCMATFDVEVPHDMGKGAENKKVHEPGDPEDD